VLAASANICNEDELTKQLNALNQIIASQEINETKQQLENSSSIDISCKKLSDPNRSNLFAGIAKAIASDDQTVTGCLSKFDPMYPMLLKHIYSDALVGSSDFKIMCAPVSKGSKAQYQSGINTITFDTAALSGAKEEDIAHSFTHEAIHSAQSLLQMSGTATGDPHASIDCCLNNDEQKCGTAISELKKNAQKSLQNMKGVPGIYDYFNSKSELTKEDESKLETVALAYQKRVQDFLSTHPECKTKDNQLNDSCADKLKNDLVEFQKDWFEHSCTAKDCKSITDFSADPYAAVKDSQRATPSKVMALNTNRPQELKTIMNDTTNYPTDVG
jgi:hypothetical protein